LLLNNLKKDIMKKIINIATLFFALFLVIENSYSQNDLCENAIVLTPVVDVTGYGNSTTGTFLGATVGSPTPTCGPNSSQDVWYKFVATATLMTISLQSYNPNYGIEIRENSCSGVIIGCINSQLSGNPNDDFASNNFSIGTTYYVRVFNSTIGNPSDYDFEISILQPPPPTNDLCQNAEIEEPCGGSCAPYYGTFHGATISDPSPNCAQNASQDVWVKFKADHVSNLITVTPNYYSGIDIAFEIYEGSCNGPQIACVNNKPTNVSEQFRETNFVIDQTYYIRVLNASSTVSTNGYFITVWYDYFPPNDLASNAELISPNPSSCNTGTLYQTTISSSLPPCSTNTDLDIWYKFVPTSSGMSIFLEAVAGLNHGMQILEGSYSGNTIGCVNANPSGSGEIFNYNNYVIGQTYFIRVFNIGGGSISSFHICITSNSPPVNDLCSNATVLTPSLDCTNTTQGFFNFSTISSTPPSCGVNSSQDVWYQFVATTPTMSITLIQAGLIDIGLQVFQGSCNGSIIGCVNLDSNVYSYNYGDITQNNFVVGQTYFVRVFNASNISVPSTFNICIKEYAAPSNDLCINAINIIPNNSYCGQPSTGEMLGSTISSAIPSCSTTIMGDVWYKFVATTSLTKIELYSYVAGLELSYEVFQNSCEGNSIFCSASTSIDTLPALTVGQTYYIRVFNTNTTLTYYGTFSICVASFPPPVNDLCVNAITLIPNTTCTPDSSNFSGASVSTPNPNCVTNATQDVWYKFVAVAPSMLINMYQSGWETGVDHSFEIYEGSCNGQSIICVNDSASQPYEQTLYNNFITGQTYYIRLMNSSNANSAYPFYICVTYNPPPNNDLCENATDLIPTNSYASEYGSLINSTISSTIPQCSTNASQDVWYRFVATNNLLKINVNVYNSNENYGFQVFQGSCSGSSLACIVKNPNEVFNGYTSDAFVVGQTYYVRVFNASNLPSIINFSIYIQTNPTLGNDFCSNAKILTINTIDSESIGYFANSYYSDLPSCSSTISSDLWYQFVATNSEMTVTLESTSNGINDDYDGGFEVLQDNCYGAVEACINTYPQGYSETYIGTNFVVGQTYYIRVFNTNYQWSVETFKIKIADNNLSVNDFEFNNLELSPNPTNDIVNLKLPEFHDFEIIDYTITNMLGQTVYSDATNYQSVDVSNFSSGIYQVVLKTNKGNWTSKFVKE
jgi:hypothetical protein